jgi:hypothetical protein
MSASASSSTARQSRDSNSLDEKNHLEPSSTASTNEKVEIDLEKQSSTDCDSSVGPTSDDAQAKPQLI